MPYEIQWNCYAIRLHHDLFLCEKWLKVRMMDLNCIIPGWIIVDGDFPAKELQSDFKLLSFEADTAGLIDFALLGMKEGFLQGIRVDELQRAFVHFKCRLRSDAGKSVVRRFMIMLVDPKKYGCIAIHDNYIEPLLRELSVLETYIHTLSRPGNGLAYYGITLIPPSSLPEFKKIIDLVGRTELQALSKKIEEAVQRHKFMIHYGI